MDLGGLAAAANPLRIPLSGPLANTFTRGYHLTAMAGNRGRVLGDWTQNAIRPAQAASFGLVDAKSVPLDPDHPRG